MGKIWDGIYACYMTSVDGQGFAVLTFSNDLIVGCDLHGVSFDGQYIVNEANILKGNVTVSIPGNTTVIQGTTAGPAGLVYEVPIEFTYENLDNSFVELKTPLGPVNLRMEKLREMNPSVILQITSSGKELVQ